MIAPYRTFFFSVDVRKCGADPVCRRVDYSPLVIRVEPVCFAACPFFAVADIPTCACASSSLIRRVYEWIASVAILVHCVANILVRDEHAFCPPVPVRVHFCRARHESEFSSSSSTNHGVDTVSPSAGSRCLITRLFYLLLLSFIVLYFIWFCEPYAFICTFYYYWKILCASRQRECIFAIWTIDLLILT